MLPRLELDPGLLMATKPPMDMKKAKADAKKRAVKRKAREASKSIPKVPKEVSKAIKDNASPDPRAIPRHRHRRQPL